MGTGPVAPRGPYEEPRGWTPTMRRFGAALGVPTTSNRYARYVHALAAYRFYMEDRLADAARALRRSTASLGWVAQLNYTIGGELEARDFGKLLGGSPFRYEVPADGDRFDALAELAERCAARVEETFGVERQPTLFALLPEDSLIAFSKSPYGYMVPKKPYFKVCLLQPVGGTLVALECPLIHEYTHVLVAELSQGESPRWLTEGLAQWAEWSLAENEEAEVLDLLPGSFPRLGEIDGIFESDLSVEDEDVQYAYAGALSAVEHLIDVHGFGPVREFLTRLPDQSEGPAFKAAFGHSLRSFEKDWHAALRRRYAEEQQTV